MIDYEKLISKLDEKKIKALLTSLKIDYVDKESYLIMKTICHHDNPDEASDKLYYYKDNKLFYCYTECGPMSIFKFLEHYYKSHDIQYDWYTDILLTVENCSVNSVIIDNFEKEPILPTIDKYRVRKVRELPVYSEGVLDIFVKMYPVEWLKDGISKEAMDKYNIRYSISQNKIIIPHYNAAGGLVGIRGRALNEWEIENIGKYAPVKIENTWYTHPLSLNLYGLNKNKENILKNGYCILYEAEKSVLQAESFKGDNCGLAVCGSNLNKYAVSILIKECRPKEIIIAFDNEEEERSDKYFLKLHALCKRYSHLCNFSFIYDSSGLTPRKSSPTDKGEEIFLELLSKRVKVK